MITVHIAVEKGEERERIIYWMNECFQCKEFQLTDSQQLAHFVIMEVRHLFDWLKVSRLRKKNPRCKIIVLLDPTILKTSPLAIELSVQDLLVKPIRKSHFSRRVKKIYDFTQNELDRKINYVDMYEEMGADSKTLQYHAPFQEAFLRRLLRGEVTSEQELMEVKTYLPDIEIPNIAFFIQGFVRYPEKRKKEGWHASVLIRHFFESRFSELGQKVSFLSYRKHLVMLMHIPISYMSFKDWHEGEQALLDVIDSLIEEYGIYLYIGVGSIYRDPIELHKSYREGRKARRMPPYERLSLRYFEEITQNSTITKCTSYIMNHFHEENLNIKRVAQCASISVPYFCRLFKKETGRSFVEYVTFVRLQNAVWQLRHTEKTIEQIAVDLGFNTPNYFSATFKKYAGLSPSEYRATEEILFH